MEDVTFSVILKNIADKAGVDLTQIKPKTGPYMIPHEKPASVPRTVNGEIVETFAPDLYNCPICKNHGYVLWVDAENKRHSNNCKCLKIRKSLVMLKKSSLGPMAYTYTFENYIANNQWRAAALKTAKDYVAKDSGWFFFGGRSGTGKTHLCVAICREMLKKGKSVQYMTWVEDGAKAKQLAAEYERYSEIVQPWKMADVLYIDDLFKVQVNANITPGDYRLAYEIINARYLDPSKLTIISSEKILEQIIGIDEAIGTRILERAMPFILNSANRENWRTNNIK